MEDLGHVLEQGIESGTCSVSGWKIQYMCQCLDQCGGSSTCIHLVSVWIRVEDPVHVSV